MNGVAKKIQTSLFLSMLCINSLFGRSPCQQTTCVDQGGPLVRSPMVPIYNASSRIAVRGAGDIYLTGSFLYYQASEDNLEVALKATTTSRLATPLQGPIVNMPFDYHPGFRVGLGWNVDYDKWDTFLEYMQFYCTNRQSASRSGLNQLFSLWQDRRFAAATYSLSHIDATWRMHLNCADWMLGRSGSVGQNLTFRTYVGARAAWINQRYTLDNTLSSDPTIITTDHYKTSSWGLGGRALLATNWVLPAGLQLYGRGAMDLIYTRYSLSKALKDPLTTATVVNLRRKEIHCVRPHAEAELGLLWGSYFLNEGYHIELAAGYDFQIFWNQNLFRGGFVDANVNGTNGLPPSGNLYLQGLTVSARFDF